MLTDYIIINENINDLNCFMSNGSSLIILSGGLDSTTLLAYLASMGQKPVALTFDYSQRNRVEICYAEYQAKRYNVSEHIIFPLSFELIKGSALTDMSLEVETGSISRSSIPNTYVPSRNTVFLAIASSLAESKGIGRVFTGINSVDYSGYPDCRPEYLKTFNELLKAGTKAGTQGSPLCIEAPFIDKSKNEILQIGFSLGVDYARTFSCYNPQGRKPCRTCDSCLFRSEAFRSMGIRDENTIYGGNL